jgi:phosphoribosylamine-glycine ligase
MRILVVGSGGREDALVAALLREAPEAHLYAAPGNPGTAAVATNLPIPADDIDRLADAADAYGIDLTVIGPEVPLALHPGRFAVTTVLAARGYPDAPAKGAAITLPTTLPEGVTLFHAGTARDADGTLRVAGGRVLNVTGTGATFAEAQARSRAGAEAVHFDGMQWRRDIGWREQERR